MVLTVTLNPCIDKTIYLDRLKIHEYNKAKYTRTDVAGKGFNVSTVLTNLEEKTLGLGFNFLENGFVLENELKRRKVPYQFVTVDGSVRTNIKLVEREHMAMTEINEAGNFVSAENLEKLVSIIKSRLPKADIMVLSGSVPPGVPADIYARLIKTARNYNVKTILDTAGDPLSLGIMEKPFLIKPNRFEFEQLCPDAAKGETQFLKAGEALVKRGITFVCISLGKDGAILLDSRQAYKAESLPIKARGLTGAGDSMVAGLCRAFRANLSTPDMLRFAMAAAAGSVRKEGTLLAGKKDIQELLPLVKVKTA